MTAPALRLPAGHHLLRVTALTPLNCGGTAGTAPVDRPVALDVWSYLPYLPSASLKGVLAGRLGNAEEGGRPNRRRSALFGAPDDDEHGGGFASPLVVGDGEPVAFPVLLRDGRRARVVVAATVFRLAALGLVAAPSLRRVEHGNAFEGPVAGGELPVGGLPLRPGRFGFDAGLVAGLTGATADEPTVVAAPDAARALWQAAAEVRTLTALGGDRRVRRGSLRTVELIPAGAVYLSLVSNLSGGEADLGARTPLQLGAWESVGYGWVRAEVVAAGAVEGGDAAEEAAAVEAAEIPSARQEVMLRAYEAMDALRGRPEAARVRSAIYDLGPRLRIRGVPATLAFCLAKAGGGEEGEGDGGGEPAKGRERWAYRWLLRRLFAVQDGNGEAELTARVVAVIAGDRPPPADFEPTRLWLRRYAETMLPREVGR